MALTHLQLPARSHKPRRAGFTMAIDKGLPYNYFADIVESASDHLDFVKFGWGTSVVTRDMEKKISLLHSEGVAFYMGGTLFEKYIIQDRFNQFRELLRDYGAEYVEVSNGTIDLNDARKSEYVAELAKDFKVISEVGSKDNVRSENMAPSRWISYISDDIDAGAQLVTLETRESGHGGICRPNGELRFGLVEDILDSPIDVNKLLFEAPSMELQSFFVRRIGADVNLGNIAPAEVIGLETIRLGLRSETLLDFEPVGVSSQRATL
ncbi:MAG: phosphosulfolactate synthase [Acidobacteria bacterium]|nr:phosphosulfolactate synthase [Acidobacteriota bacterium]